mmetsp:Transcript_2574/g.9828  ORF Transcript_2574/g.9828 Transcript_2574/m.9828 type:complete len:209 (+) Transcript_2574:2957-3583(+)
MQSTFITLLVLFSIVAVSVAQNKYTVDRVSGCNSAVLTATLDANYGACKATGVESSSRVTCSGDTEITLSWDNSTSCVGTAIASVNSTLPCSVVCSSSVPISGSYAEINNYDNCNAKTLVSTLYLATGVCQPVQDTSMQFLCHKGDLLVGTFEGASCKTVRNAKTKYTKKVCAAMDNRYSEIVSCNGAASLALEFSAILVAVLALIAF